MRSLALAAPLLAAAPASAQDRGPSTVNDCTLFRDPGQLRDCINRFEGAPPAPAVPTQPERPADADLKEAQASGSDAAAARAARPAAPRAAAAPAPSSREPQPSG